MKKIKFFSIFFLLSALGILLTGCNSKNSDSDVEDNLLNGRYSLGLIYEAHEEPCNQIITMAGYLSSLSQRYDGSYVTLQSVNRNSGTFSIVLSEFAEESDTYFKILNGNYTFAENLITMSHNQIEMTCTFENDKLLFTVDQIESELMGHEGHVAKVVFPFYKVS